MVETKFIEVPVEKIVEIPVKFADPRLLEEHQQLKDDYDSLLKDLKNQINVNEGLKKSVLDLENLIESYNKNPQIPDNPLKSHIEMLLKDKTKNIPYKSQKDIIRRAENEMNCLRNKLDKLDDPIKPNNSIPFENPAIIPNNRVNLVGQGNNNFNDFNYPGQYFKPNNVPITQANQQYIHNFSPIQNKSINLVSDNHKRSGSSRKSYEYYNVNS